jgi:hypothetical protein
MQIESILAVIAGQVFQAKTLQAAQAIFHNHVQPSKIKEEDKTKMLTEVGGMKSLTQLQRYTANALLKYEGLGTSL